LSVDKEGEGPCGVDLSLLLGMISLLKISAMAVREEKMFLNNGTDFLLGSS
jgi:hypothetical protein